MEQGNDNERIIEKLNFFLIQKTKVHIKKHNKIFLNGYVFERLKKNIYLMKEDELGIIHLFVSEIYDVGEFKEE